MKLAKYTGALFIGLMSHLVMGDMVKEAPSSEAARSAVASSEPSPSAPVNGAQVITYYKALEKTRKLTLDESKIFQFALVATEVFKVTEFEISGHSQNGGKEKAVDARSMAKAIQKSLKQSTNWDEPIPSADLEKIKTVEELIKTNLGANSFAAAWLIYKNGNKAEAKAILNRGFDQAFENAMKVDYLGFSEESNYILSGESFSKALIPMSTEAENKVRADRLRKMRVHASNLPQIMT